MRSMRVPGWIRDEGWFDDEWYLRKYPEVADSGMEPVRHYWRHGRFEGRRPSGSTKIAELRIAHPRSYRGPGYAPPPRRFAPGQSRGKTIRRPRGRRIESDVAVMVHCFYPDVFAGMVRHLRPLRRSATLFVSVCDPLHVDEVERIIDRSLGRGVPRVVKVVPNRGRNFAPLIVGFGGEISRHEYLLHLHTKKSLYIGYERSDWRGHLLKSLAGRSARRIVRVFVENDKVGVIQPAPFHQMPPWVSHWLSNVAHGRALFARLGMDPDDAQGYLDYPIGGMFWARVEAIRPLLHCGLTVEDFEPEAGQTDGTLAHAIERTITALAVHRGFDFVEADLDSKSWKIGWSGRNVDAFGEFHRSALRRRLEQARLLTVDVFDTLVLRPALDPVALQYFAARAVSSGPGEAAELLARRVAAERAARAERPDLGDVSIDEVYAVMPAESQKMRAEELAIESRSAMPRQWLIDDLRAVKKTGVRLVAATDTTLPRDTVEDLLVQVGARDLFDEVYVSNECRARKDTGTMWALIEQQQGIPPSDWVHLGDNEQSDIQVPNHLTIGTALISAPRTVAQFYDLTDGSLHGDWATAAALGLSAVRLYDGGTPDDRNELFGYAVLGPLLASFLSRLGARRREHPDERMLMFARDCHLVYRAAGEMGIDCTYFRMPRRIALAATQAAGAEFEMVVDAAEFRGALGAMLEARLGFRSEGGPLDTEVQLPRDRVKVLSLLDEVRDEVERHGREQLDGVRRYMRSLGIADDDALCVVDLGYSATTQRSLGRVLSNPMHGIYWVTMPEAAKASSIEGWFGEDERFLKGNWFLDNSLLLESLVSAVEGQATGFDTNGLPLLGSVPDVDVARIETVQSAALQFVRDLRGMFGPAVLETPIHPERVLAWASRVPRRILPSPADMFESMRIENAFVGRSDDAAVTDFG